MIQERFQDLKDEALKVGVTIIEEEISGDSSFWPHTRTIKYYDGTRGLISYYNSPTFCQYGYKEKQTIIPLTATNDEVINIIINNMINEGEIIFRKNLNETQEEFRERIINMVKPYKKEKRFKKSFKSGDQIILLNNFKQIVSIEEFKDNYKEYDFELRKYQFFRIIDITGEKYIIESEDNNNRYMFSSDIMQKYFDIKEKI